MAVLVYSKPVVGNLRPAARELHLCGPLIYILSNRILLLHTYVHCQFRNEIYSTFSGLHWAYTQVHVKTKIAAFSITVKLLRSGYSRLEGAWNL